MTWRRRLRRQLNQRIERGPIPRAALEVLAGKRLAVSDHWTDVWREEHATAFTAARLTSEQLVEDVHRELVAALGAGETMETFRARVQPLLERRGWAPPRRGGDVPTRLARIYRTNMRTARAAGRWQRIERRAKTMPYLLYLRSTAPEPRSEHLVWVGIILPVTDPWWDTHCPPNGWGCRCRVRQISARERARRLAAEPGAYRTEAPPDTMVEWTNPATGELREVATGIDPGWDTNPGRHRTLGIHRRDAERTEALLSGRTLGALAAPVRAELARTRIARHVAGPDFRWFLHRPRPPRPPRREARPEFVDATPIAVAPERLRAVAEADRALLYLDAAVADKQWRRHGPGQKRPAAKRTVPVAWWADIQAILETVAPRREGGRRWVYDDAERGRRLVVARDPGGHLVVISYHPR